VRKRPIRRLLPDGSVEFDDASVIPAVDHLLFCTGYLYRFPFLEGPDAVVQVDDNAVRPLYKSRICSLSRMCTLFRMCFLVDVFSYTSRSDHCTRSCIDLNPNSTRVTLVI
jgi:hypothetical protein